MLSDVYPEETYVDVIRLGREVRVDLDCALLPRHHLYVAPRPGAVDSYAAASLVFAR